MDRRRAQATEFYQTTLDSEEQPWYVSDQATLHDVCLGDESLLAARCRQHYGVGLRHEQFAIPVWRLLDYLSEHRIR